MTYNPQIHGRRGATANSQAVSEMKKAFALTTSYADSSDAPCQYYSSNFSDGVTATLTQERLLCPFCDASFTGDYAKGNRTRHVKQQHHAQEPNPRLWCETCNKWFKRTDAKLLHDRRMHPNPMYSVTTDTATDNQLTEVWMENNRWLPPDTEEDGISETARQVIQDLHKHLPSYDVQLLFHGLESVIEYMQQESPSDELSRGLVIAMRWFQEAYRDYRASYPCTTTYPNVSGNQYSQDSTVTLSLMAQGNLNPAMSENDSMTLDNSGRMLARRNTRTDSTRERLFARRFACHCQKHNAIYGGLPVCRYPGAPCVSDIVQHMTRNDHRTIVPGLELCRECWTYRDDQYPFCQNSHDFPQGQRLPQPRGSAGQEEQWYAVWRLIYPQAPPPDSPYVSEDLLQGDFNLSGDSSGSQQPHVFHGEQTPFQDQFPGAQRTTTASGQRLDSAALQALHSFLYPDLSRGSSLFSDFVQRLITARGYYTPEQLAATGAYLIALYTEQLRRDMNYLQRMSPESGGLPANAYSTWNDHSLPNTASMGNSQASPSAYEGTNNYSYANRGQPPTQFADPSPSNGHYESSDSFPSGSHYGPSDYFSIPRLDSGYSDDGFSTPRTGSRYPGGDFA